MIKISHRLTRVTRLARCFSAVSSLANGKILCETIELNDSTSFENRIMNQSIDVYYPRKLDETLSNEEYNELLKNIADRNCPVFVPADPGSYLTVGRIVSQVRDKALYNAENIVNYQDPIKPFSFEEINFDFEKMDIIIQAQEQKEKTKLNLEELLKEDSEFFENENKWSSLITETANLTDEQIQKNNTKAFKLLEETLFKDSYKYPGTLSSYVKSMVFSLNQSVILAGPTEIMYRIVLASTTSPQEFMKIAIDCYNFWIVNKDFREGFNNPQEMIAATLYTTMFSFIGSYTFSLAVKYMEENNVQPVIFMPREMVSEIKQLSSKNFPFIFDEITEIKCLDTEKYVLDFTERHAYLDALIGNKFWDSSLIDNKFPYINLDKREINDNYLEIAERNFFKSYKKASIVMNKLNEAVKGLNIH